MKLQIKTFNQKVLSVDIEETKTVYDLKKELSLYADVGVQPEQQKLIYNGKILNNVDPLTTYNIDERKCLGIIILKQPIPDESVPVNRIDANVKDENLSEMPSTNSETSVEKKEENVVPNKEKKDDEDGIDDDMVKNIANMGYPEQEVRNALKASFNNPDRAVEYLIEGIPTEAVINDEIHDDEESVTDIEDISMRDFIRNNENFGTMQRAIYEDPHLVDESIQHLAETNPEFSELIGEHQQEFLSMMMEGLDYYHNNHDHDNSDPDEDSDADDQNL